MDMNTIYCEVENNFYFVFDSTPYIRFLLFFILSSATFIICKSGLETWRPVANMVLSYIKYNHGVM
jgi:hypothetical protein